MPKNRRTSSTILLLIMIIFFCFLALTCAPYNHNLLIKAPKLSVEEATLAGVFSFSNVGDNTRTSVLLNQTTRMEIYDFIKDNPGLHFRALSNGLSMPIGVLQYHLGLLVNGGLLSTYKDGRYRRYFESKKFTETEMKLISTLRHETQGKILTELLRRPRIAHKDLATQLNLSSQALSWQIRCLEEKGLVKRENENLNVRYTLDEDMSLMVHQCLAVMNRIVPH